jgi:predicted RNA-binding protein with PIN domain
LIIIIFTWFLLKKPRQRPVYRKFAQTNKNKYKITVATSDGLQQIIIRGAGSNLLSARELKEEIKRANDRLNQEFQKAGGEKRNYLMDTLSEEEKLKLNKMIGIKREKTKIKNEGVKLGYAFMANFL